MNHQDHTNDSRIMMYEAVRTALEADDELIGFDEQPRFCVRETCEWKQHAAGLEAETLKRGLLFEVID